MGEKMGKDSNKFIVRVQDFFRAPLTRTERIRAGSGGFAFICSSLFLVLLRGISSVTVFGILISVALGMVSGFLIRKYPEKRVPGIVLGIMAGLSFINAIPGLRIIGTIVLGLGTWAFALLGAWKIGSTIYSVFTRNR